ncbi:Gfo/Idh/MocA family oxidoreductase [Alteromonas sp. C1M14]|uniref:Gfo/Idh/MocA family oxidoreductase n=1 Tax=Alteromonas sp. C1M14 TaxID=2841567 RepID=UPI001C094897|nr:Gfo/Idh/MocA family oxidoreductase [Alteromonas sp. C1M14]MBU2978249.1 Gfo/Idh/MocA family oxidoreductase [Alteromonas sp. C1M14]
MIRTLLVGFGFSAKTFHLPFLQSIADFDLVGVVSSRPDAVTDMLPGMTVYSSMSKALAAAEIDLVVITTPNTLHAMQARQALMFHCHVLVEKPFTLSSDDAKALVSLAKEKQRVLCVYQNRRFDGDFLTVKKLIANNKVGHVRRFVSRFDRFRPTPRDRWRENAGPGAGILWDLGPHLFDQAVQLFGLPKQVLGVVQTLREGGQSDDSFDITLFYENTTVTLGSSPFQAQQTIRFDLQGDKGSYRKLGLDPQENQLKQGLTFDDSQWAVTPSHQHGQLSNGEELHTIQTEHGGYLQFYDRLAQTLSGDGEIPASGESVLPVIQLIELALESAETGKTLPVYLDMKENN